MPLTPEGWHQRYLEQAHWTGELRKYLFEKSNLAQATRCLDVGCGTGAIEYDYVANSHQLPVGLDIDHAALTLARKNISLFNVVQGDARDLPFASMSFQISFCHFVLLWVEAPHLVIAEMARVTRAGGVVIAIAEPDYGGRIDYPGELSQIGDWQIDALRINGADPQSGRKLPEMFSQAGLVDIESGVIGGRWRQINYIDDFDSEWKVIETDLETLNPSPREIDLAHRLKQEDAAARLNGSRILYVPTFYAWGRVPGVI
jgi:SAM-dependent methyltransferase